MTEIPEVLERKEKKSKFLILLVGGVVFLCIGLGTLIFLSNAAQSKTLPGLMIGDISVANMQRDELKNFLNTMSSKLLADGIHLDLSYKDTKHDFVLSPELVTDADVVEFIRIDTEAEADRIFAIGKTSNMFANALTYLRSRMSSQHMSLTNISVDRVRLAGAIHEKIKEFEAPPKESTLLFSSFDPVKVSFTSSTEGYVYNINESIEAIEKSWSLLQNPSIHLTSHPTSPVTTEASWEALLPDISKALSLGPLILDQRDPSAGLEKEWKIPVSTYAPWIVVSRGENGLNTFTLDFASTTKYLENKIGSVIGEKAENAKFQVDENGKVVEFQAARVGFVLDTTSTYFALQSSFKERLTSASNTPVKILLVEEQPDLGTAEVNNLGIKEILGSGVSNFSGSPSNRIKNIRNAVRKLNGILIKPGEEFSAIKYTQPYSLEGGYFPELVIKGDEIKPEIGGGLCQIGTTLFRMAMNSGMKITERRNHSLAITYYNDPSNGQPGTDATIYEPSPDFRFLNDSPNYILIQTFMNEKTGELKFTLWGTDDGRKGSYSKPLVSKRLPAGPTRFTETTTLPPGQKKCQHAYPGAVASFTYTRILADGTKENQVFDSYYRSLPEICLVGVEKVTSDPLEVPADAALGVPLTTASSTN